MGHEPIRNPYVGSSDYHCFGCAPHNRSGLRMRFCREGEEVVCRWQPRDEYQGYVNVLHGGIQATLMDETASWAIFIRLGTSGVTVGLEIEYLQPVFIDGGEVAVRGSVRGVEKKIATIDVTLYQGEREPLSRGICRYRIYPEALARRLLNFPGAESFRSP